MYERQDDYWPERGRHPIRLVHGVDIGSISSFLSESFVFLCMFTRQVVVLQQSDEPCVGVHPMFF